MKNLKILELQIKNIAGIEAFELSPNGDHVVIGGPNAAGKTSVLSAITGALGGKKNRPSKPVRNGAEKGEVVADLGDIVVKWRAREKGNEYLSVESKEGAVFKSPQKMLEKLWGERTFDPLQFFQADSRDQASQLARLVGTDLDEFDKRVSELRTERTLIGREGKKAKGAADSISRVKDAPKEPVDVSHLAGELAEWRSYNSETENKRNEINSLETTLERSKADAQHKAETFQYSIEQERINGRKRIDTLKKNITDLEKELAQEKSRLESTIKDVDKRIKESQKDVEVLRVEMNAKQTNLVSEIESAKESLEKREEKDENKILDRIRKADELNSAYSQNKRADELDKRVKELREDYDKKTEEIEKVLAEKSSVIDAAPIPVDGLGLEAGAVTFNGRPLAQCSAAERLKISIALGLAENPAIKVMLIDRWQDLDDDSREIVRSMANEAGVQIWTTVVGSYDKDITVEIREGRIIEKNEDEQGALFDTEN